MTATADLQQRVNSCREFSKLIRRVMGASPSALVSAPPTNMIAMSTTPVVISESAVELFRARALFRNIGLFLDVHVLVPYEPLNQKDPVLSKPRTTGAVNTSLNAPASFIRRYCRSHGASRKRAGPFRTSFPMLAFLG